MSARKWLETYPLLNLVLCAFFAYVGILCVMLGLAARLKLNFFAAAAVSLIAAYHLFRNFQKIRAGKR
jgi:hypothetical protein